jgi:hypothetical protein
LGTCPLLGSCAIVQTLVGPIRVPLNGVCLPRSYPPGDVDCTTDAECHTCVGGENAGKTCGKTASDCPNGSCSGSGTCQLAQMDIVPGTKNANNEIPLTVPQSSLVLNPTNVSGIGAVCVGAGGDGNGLIDCDGGYPNLNATSMRDHNTTPKVCLSGTNKGQACTKNADCPGAAGNAGCNLGNGLSGPFPTPGVPDDPTCTSKLQQPDGSFSYACLEETKQCWGGSNEGAVCTADTDCPGSTCAFCNIGANGGPHPGVCNSPQQVTQEGTFQPGDMFVALPLSITILSALPPSGIPPANWGPDGLACTADDTAAPSPPVTVLLSTGTNTVCVCDAGNFAGVQIGPGATCAGQPCIAQVVGQGVSCPNLTAGTVTGMKLGGGFPALDGPAGDVANIFQFLAQ